MPAPKPATPLPWNVAGDQTSGCIVKAGDGIASHVAKYHDQWVCEEHGNTDGYGAFRNAAYIAHAANAYPRLVEMLQIVRTIAGMRLEQDDRPEWAKLKQCDALLAELGEDA